VSYNGSSYIAAVATTGVNPAGAPAYWSLLAQEGAQGPAGATGPQGPPGTISSVTSDNLAFDTASLQKMTGGMGEDSSENIYLSDHTLFLRSDQDHGVGYFGSDSTSGNTTFANYNVNGPVVFGWDGGALGADQNGNQNLALQWDANQNVTIPGALQLSKITSGPLWIECNTIINGNADQGSLALDVIGKAYVQGNAEIVSGLSIDGYNLPDTYALYVQGNTFSSGGWSGSDARWKKNVRPLAKALDKVSRLQGVTYDWRREEFPEKHFDAGAQLGFLAQDVEQVVPEVVRTDANGYKAVAYEKLTVVLTEAMKEQQTEIESLKARNESLKEDVARLKEAVDRLLAKSASSVSN
jgi:hypothetical protein